MLANIGSRFVLVGAVLVLLVAVLLFFGARFMFQYQMSAAGVQKFKVEELATGETWSIWRVNGVPCVLHGAAMTCDFSRGDILNGLR